MLVVMAAIETVLLILLCIFYREKEIKIKKDGEAEKKQKSVRN
jgi:hypothetical protein